MQSFQEFFIIHERQSWGMDAIHAEKISQLIAERILSGKISLIGNNTMAINMPMFRLEIVLKAFNNYKGEAHQGAKAFFLPPDPNKEEDVAKIVIFIFEIFSSLKNYRGYPIGKLNIILRNFVEKNFATPLFKALQHELTHAFEYNRIGSLGGSNAADVSDIDRDKEYLNRHEEINARIVERIYPTNRLWNLYFRRGEWLQKRPSKESINDITHQIVNSFELLSLLEPKKQRKFIKGVYSTLNFIWEYFTKNAEQENFRNEIKKSDLSRIFDKFSK